MQLLVPLLLVRNGKGIHALEHALNYKLIPYIRKYLVGLIIISQGLLFAGFVKNKAKLILRIIIWWFYWSSTVIASVFIIHQLNLIWWFTCKSADLPN